MLFLKLSLLALMPLAVSIGMYLLEKHTKFANFDNKKKQILYGVIFGLIAILSTEFGQLLNIRINNGAILNCRDASVLIAGLIFGAPAGLISGFMGGIHRYLAVFWGAGAYTQIACSVSTIFAGIVGAILRLFLFDNKKPSIFYALMIGFVIEVFHMLMVFFTNMDDVEQAFRVVQNATLPMVLINGLTVMLSVLVITLIGKEKLIVHDHGVKTISSLFQRWLLITVLIAYILTSAFTINMQVNASQTNTEKTLSVNIQDVKKDVLDTSNEEILKIAEQVKIDIQGTAETLPITLEQAVEKYKIKEINIIDATGKIRISTDSSFEGYDMNSGEQSKDFLYNIKKPENQGKYVQEFGEISESTEELRIYRKYAGVEFGYGEYLQIGYDVEGFQHFVDDFILKSVQNRRVGNEGYLVVINSKGEIVASRSDMFESLGGIHLRDEYFNIIKAQENGKVIAKELEINGITDPYYCMFEETESYYIVSLILQSEADLTRDLTIYISIFMEIIVFVCLFVLIYLLVKKLVVNNIKKVNESLAQITGGNLDVVVNVRNNEEFASLSDDINSTVFTLKHYIEEAAARIDKELEFAKTIQHSVLPSVFPPFPDIKAFDIYASMYTAKEVGGDFYDFYFVGQNKIAILVADVSGKGIPAAMFMMTAKSIIKGYAESGKEVNDVLSLANKRLCENNEANMFVTAWMGVVDFENGTIEYANAGHNPPLIKRNLDKVSQFEYLNSMPGFVLGGIDGVKYKKQTIKFEKGDTIFIYTDGVTEATNLNSELYGEERLQKLLNSTINNSCKEICDAVKVDVDKFVGEAPQFDDITMLAFRLNESNDMNELKVEATIENIEKVTNFVNEHLEKYDCPIKIQTQIDIAIDELFSNIAHYAYNPETGSATVRVEVEKNPLAVIVTFIDNGVPYDPLKKADPDTTMSAEDREIGGLGIFMVKKTMDDITYEYKNGQNILRIKKNI